MKKEKTLIIVNTEIGLLTALIYYTKYLREKEVIFLLLKVNDNRFENLNFENLPNVYKVKNELTSNKFFPDIEFKKYLKYENVTQIIIQNPLEFMSQIFINNYIKKNNCKLTMLSDGLLLERGIGKNDILKLSIKILLRKYLNGLFLLPNKIKLYTDMINVADEFIAHKNIGFKQFISSSDLIADNILKNKNLITDIFKIDIIPFQKADIIFFSQPLYKQTYITKKEKENYKIFLDNFFKFTKENKIHTIIKLHPGDIKVFYENYESEYTKIDDQKNTPAEIILTLVNNKLVFSMFSSVSLYNTNYTNSHYWLFELMDYKIDKLVNINHINNLSHMEDLKLEIFDKLGEKSFE